MRFQANTWVLLIGPVLFLISLGSARIEGQTADGASGTLQCKGSTIMYNKEVDGSWTSEVVFADEKGNGMTRSCTYPRDVRPGCAEVGYSGFRLTDGSTVSCTLNSPIDMPEYGSVEFSVDGSCNVTTYRAPAPDSNETALPPCTFKICGTSCSIKLPGKMDYTFTEDERAKSCNDYFLTQDCRNNPPKRKAKPVMQMDEE